MKRHFNMAPLYSDRRIVERAKEMLDMYASDARIELGIGWTRINRLIHEYGLEFKRRNQSYIPNTKIKTNQDMIDHFKVAKIDGVMCKKCTQCLEVKTVESYHRDKSKNSGRVSACKSCISSRKAALLGGH